MHADAFRRAYQQVRTSGYLGTRAEFARLVLNTPAVFRGSVVVGARSWSASRGEFELPAVPQSSVTPFPRSQVSRTV